MTGLQRKQGMVGDEGMDTGFYPLLKIAVNHSFTLKNI